MALKPLLTNLQIVLILMLTLQACDMNVFQLCTMTAHEYYQSISGHHETNTSLIPVGNNSRSQIHK